MSDVKSDAAQRANKRGNTSSQTQSDTISWRDNTTWQALRANAERRLMPSDGNASNVVNVFILSRIHSLAVRPTSFYSTECGVIFQDRLFVVNKFLIIKYVSEWHFRKILTRTLSCDNYLFLTPQRRRVSLVWCWSWDSLWQGNWVEVEDHTTDGGRNDKLFIIFL